MVKDVVQCNQLQGASDLLKIHLLKMSSFYSHLQTMTSCISDGSVLRGHIAWSEDRGHHEDRGLGQEDRRDYEDRG